jgi:hypothetical protein
MKLIGAFLQRSHCECTRENNLPLVRSVAAAHSAPVAPLFTKFGLFLNTPREQTTYGLIHYDEEEARTVQTFVFEQWDWDAYKTLREQGSTNVQNQTSTARKDR